MIDLEKKSHSNFKEGFYKHATKPTMGTETKEHYLAMANAAEMRGNYKFALSLRQLACGLRVTNDG